MFAKWSCRRIFLQIWASLLLLNSAFAALATQNPHPWRPFLSFDANWQAFYEIILLGAIRGAIVWRSGKREALILTDFSASRRIPTRNKINLTILQGYWAQQINIGEYGTARLLHFQEASRDEPEIFAVPTIPTVQKIVENYRFQLQLCQRASELTVVLMLGFDLSASLRSGLGWVKLHRDHFKEI